MSGTNHTYWEVRTTKYKCLVGYFEGGLPASGNITIPVLYREGSFVRLGSFHIKVDDKDGIIWVEKAGDLCPLKGFRWA